jgi:ribonuclease T2
MKQIALIACLALLLPLAGCGPQPQNPQTGAANSATAQGAASPNTSASAGFDFYLLNLSWSPEFCFSHPTAAECASHPAFVLHGMWPQNNDGTYPENCSNAPGPSDPTQYIDIYPDQGLLAHEWQTHGTCSGMGADAFFAAARTAYHSVTIPPTLTGLTSQTSLPPDQILDLFTASNPAIPRSSLALSCGHNYLTAVEVCLDKSLHPVSCSAVRSCRANTVRIPPPGQ